MIRSGGRSRKKDGNDIVILVYVSILRLAEILSDCGFRISDKLFKIHIPHCKIRDH